MPGIRDFAVEETGVLELLDAADEPMMGADGKRMTITMYSPGSKQYAKAQAAKQNRMIEKLRKKGKIDETAEQKRREEAEFLADCTKEFSSNIEADGLVGKELFKSVYSDISIGFVAEQAGKFGGEWGNFSKPSTTSLAST